MFGALFVVVAGGCATGIVGDAGDGGDLSDAPLAAMDSGAADSSSSTDSGKADTGSKADTGAADTGSSVCADWAGPTVTSTCTDSCNATTHVCGPNGCYNMWWCNIPSGICSAKPPTGC